MLEQTAISQMPQKGSLQVFEAQLEGARYAKVSEAGNQPICVAVYKALCEGGQERPARAGYECRRTDQIVVKCKVLLVLTSNAVPTLPHSTTQHDKEAAADRWNSVKYQLSFKGRVTDPETQRLANNIYKLRAETGYYNKELWAHLRRARLTIHEKEGIARYLWPQAPMTLCSKEVMKGEETPEQQILSWLQTNTSARESESRRGSAPEACAPWYLILKLMRADIPLAVDAVQNVTKVVTKNGYKTSGEGHPRVTWPSQSQGWALTHGGSALSLVSGRVSDLEKMLQEEPPLIARLLQAAAPAQQ